MSQIHQEVAFSAPPGQVYRALLDSREFAKITGKPAEIDPEEGGAFSCFGGYITGRHVELIPNKRIVQAWRAGSWPAGHYSIVSFDLTADGLKTKMVFDQRGAPEGEIKSLTEGWGKEYWEPLKRYLGG
jgi:activator of HSP90 ATPase